MSLDVIFIEIKFNIKLPYPINTDNVVIILYTIGFDPKW